jgi:membrane protease YdiL (CAAX protease family)
VINQPSSLQQPVDEQSNMTPTQVASASGVLPAPPAYQVATIDPEHPPWAQPPWLGALKAFLNWVASVASLLFVPLILVIPYLIYRMTAAPGQVVVSQLETDKTFLFLSVLGVIPAHIVTFLICYVIVTGWRNYPIGKTLGLSWPSSWGPIKGTLICVLIAAALFGGGALITWLFPGDKTQLDLLIESSNGARVVTAFLAIVTAPVVEEIVYRGILYPAINGVLGSAVAIGLVSLFFAAVHFLQYKNNLAVIGVITLVSITLTAVRAYTHRLLPCLVIHLVFNGIQAIIILLYPFLPKPEAAPQPTPGELLPFVSQLFS